MIAGVLTNASCTQPTCDLTNRHIPSLQRASGSGRAYRDLAPGGRAAQVADCEDVAAHRARRRIPDGLRGPLLGCLRRGSIGSSYTSSLSQNVFPTPLPDSPPPTHYQPTHNHRVQGIYCIAPSPSRRMKRPNVSSPTSSSFRMQQKWACLPNYLTLWSRSHTLHNT